MQRLLSAVFGAHGQVVLGVVSFTISVAFWTIGCFVIPHALSLPWRWTPSVFIFHASMFALVIASLGYIGTGLGYRATERVETAVIENIEHADAVDVD